MRCTRLTVHGTPRHTLTSPLAFPRPHPPRRLDARDRRVEGLVMDLMVRAAPHPRLARASRSHVSLSFHFIASSSSSFSRRRRARSETPRARSGATFRLTRTHGCALTRSGKNAHGTNTNRARSRARAACVSPGARRAWRSPRWRARRLRALRAARRVALFPSPTTAPAPLPVVSRWTRRCRARRRTRTTLRRAFVPSPSRRSPRRGSWSSCWTPRRRGTARRRRCVARATSFWR